MECDGELAAGPDSDGIRPGPREASSAGAGSEFRAELGARPLGCPLFPNGWWSSRAREVSRGTWGLRRRAIRNQHWRGPQIWGLGRSQARALAVMGRHGERAVLDLTSDGIRPGPREASGASAGGDGRANKERVGRDAHCLRVDVKGAAGPSSVARSRGNAPWGDLETTLAGSSNVRTSTGGNGPLFEEDNHRFPPL